MIWYPYPIIYNLFTGFYTSEVVTPDFFHQHYKSERSLDERHDIIDIGWDRRFFGAKSQLHNFKVSFTVSCLPVCHSQCLDNCWHEGWLPPEGFPPFSPWAQLCSLASFLQNWVSNIQSSLNYKQFPTTFCPSLETPHLDKHKTRTEVSFNKSNGWTVLGHQILAPVEGASGESGSVTAGQTAGISRVQLIERPQFGWSLHGDPSYFTKESSNRVECILIDHVICFTGMDNSVGGSSSRSLSTLG